jgi:hypothetical protein
MKNTLCLIALGAALILLAAPSTAQDLIIYSLGATEDVQPVRNTPGPPKYCSPCLFYAGDWNNTDPNWDAVADWDLPIYGQAALYTPFSVPKGKTWTVTAIFANVGFISTNKMDPGMPEWSINSGMSPGNGGKVIASGRTTNGTAKPTGRKGKWAGLPEVIEYTVMVKLPKPVRLAGGKTYWESVVPPCTNTHDSTCFQTIYYYETDTYDPTHTKPGAHAFGPKQPPGLALDNYPYYRCAFLSYQPCFLQVERLPGLCLQFLVGRSDWYREVNRNSDPTPPISRSRSF